MKILRYIMFSMFIFSLRIAYCQESDKIKNTIKSPQEQKKYQRLELAYERKLEIDPNSAPINYDLGVAQFKNAKFDKSIGSFQKALLTDDKNLEGMASYNLGNSEYKLAESIEKKDLSKAVNLLEDSLRHYKSAIEHSPQDKDAKVNYEIASKKYEELKEKLKKQPPQKGGSQNKDQKTQEQKKESSSGESQDNKSQPQGREGKGEEEKNKEQESQKQQEPQGQEKNESSEESGKRDQEGQQEKGSKEEKSGEKSGAQPLKAQENPKEMSEKEAKMLLNGFRQQEAFFGQLRDKEQAKVEEAEKNW